MVEQFRIRHQLGDSLFGKVFLCDYNSSNSRSSRATASTASALPSPPATTTPVAVKCISLRKVRQLRRTSFPRAIDNPVQEQKVTELLLSHGGHCNLLQTHASFVDGDTMFMVMEYCSGGDLYEHVQARPNGLLSEMEALRFMKQIVSGVDFLHQHGIAHRDLSLENILLTSDNICKIADFGVSTDASRKCSGFVGKDYYIAPEIVAGQRYDPVGADVWSLGVMLFMMLTGSPLFSIASRTAKGFVALERLGVSAVLGAWGFSSTVSEETTELLAEMLQVDPSKRAHIDEILLRLDLLLVL
ncbi:unnamed protein product [Globisporangium polare]